jgi:serine beta-lactamase-like protein LACTB, mitochondrial
MKSTRWRAEAALAVLVVVVMLIVSGGAIWFVSTMPVHQDAAAVPSTAAAVPSDKYAGPVEESRRLARALAAGDNLPGLSVAVAVDGEIVWAEGFGWADVDSRTPVTPLTRFRLGGRGVHPTSESPGYAAADGTARETVSSYIDNR